MKKLIVYIMTFVLLTLAISAVTIKAGDQITIDKPISDNLFVSGGEISINEPIEGDLIITGGSISVDANTKDIIAAGGQIELDGNAEDIIAAGGVIDVNGNVSGDLIVAGGQISISENTVIERDVLISGGQLTVDGHVLGDLEANGGIITINNIIEGNATIVAQEVVLGDNAMVKGNLIVPLDADIDPSKVEGTVIFRQMAQPEITPTMKLISFVLGKLALLLTLFGVGVLLLSLQGEFLQKTENTLAKDYWQLFLLGFALLVAIPIAAIILIITLIGIPLGLILFGVYVLSILVSQVVLSYYLGELIVERIFKIKVTSLYIQLLIGVLVFILVTSIPIAGGILGFFMLLLGMGASYKVLFSKKRMYKKSK